MTRKKKTKNKKLNRDKSQYPYMLHNMLHEGYFNITPPDLVDNLEFTGIDINKLYKPQEEASILTEAESLIRGDRNKTYGDFKDNVKHVSEILGTVFGVSVKEEQIAQTMIALKMARFFQNKTHRDSYVDACGYLALYYENYVQNKGDVSE